VEAVRQCAEESFAKAAEDVKSLPNYTVDGEERVQHLMTCTLFPSFYKWVIMNACHD